MSEAMRTVDSTIWREGLPEKRGTSASASNIGSSPASASALTSRMTPTRSATVSSLSAAATSLRSRSPS